MTAEPEGGGIDVQEAMRWGRDFLRGITLTEPQGPRSIDPGFRGGGSANMKGLYSALWYAFALSGRAGSAHRERLLGFLAQSEKVHGLEETGTLSATHAQLWCGFLFFALWAAAKAGDKEVADALIRHIAVDFALWRALSVGGPVPDVWSPGARAKDTAKKGHGELMGSNSARTACRQLIALLDPVAGAWQRKLVHVGDNPYNLGPLALRETPKEIVAEIKKEALEVARSGFAGVKLCNRLQINRWPSGDFYAVFAPPLPVAKGARGDGPAHAAGVVEGVRWIEALGDLESLYPHISRYPTRPPSLTIDMEGAA